MQNAVNNVPLAPRIASGVSDQKSGAGNKTTDTFQNYVGIFHYLSVTDVDFNYLCFSNSYS